MKVKISNKIYDSENEPILLILTDQDKQNINNMHKDSYKFCSYPDEMHSGDIEKWMKAKK